MRCNRILLGAAVVALFPLQASAQAAGSTDSAVQLRGAPIPGNDDRSLLEILLGIESRREGDVWDRRGRDDGGWGDVFGRGRDRGNDDWDDDDWERERRRQLECRQRSERARLKLRHEHERWHVKHDRRDRHYFRKHDKLHDKLEHKARKDLRQCDDVARGRLGGRIDWPDRRPWPRPPGGGHDRDGEWERGRGGGGGS